jgi:acetyl-CoA acetyltransferase
LRDVIVAGVGMTPFGKFTDSTLRQIASQATAQALGDAGIPGSRVQMAFFGNAVEGLLTGQEMIRGQVVLQESGIGGVCIVNVENACASGSSAVHLAWLAVASGHVDIALAVGAEKLTNPDKVRTFDAIGTGVDLQGLEKVKSRFYGAAGPPPGERSFFMDVYADAARHYAERTGATVEDFARVAVKNHHHGVLNPRAQYREEISVEEVLQSRVISDPLTLLMCSPIGDGAAALVLCSEDVAKELGSPRVRIAASVLLSGWLDGPKLTSVQRASQLAYEKAGIGPKDIDVIELHDAAAPAELYIYEDLQLCDEGGGAELLKSGATSLGGRVPCNMSGGLLSKGHPVGATGAAQLVELVEQLRGDAGDRQVEGARVALAENNGGYLGPDCNLGPEPAAISITILTR